MPSRWALKSIGSTRRVAPNAWAGHFDTPQCVEVCPVDCIPVNPERVESKGELQKKYEGLMARKSGAASPA